MISMTCDVEPTEGSLTMDEIARRLGPDQLNIAVGRAARNAVYLHLIDLNAATQNPLGAQKSNYYGQAARSTSFTADSDSALITIRQIGMSLHYYGGTVEPGKNASSSTGKPTEYLTLPACAEAYGKHASDFGDQLEVLWGRRGPYALALKTSGTPSAKGASKAYNRNLAKQAGRAMFWLIKSATITPNPDVMPSEEDLQEAIGIELEKLLTTLELRSGEQSSEPQNL